jgi:hypothetical protein
MKLKLVLCLLASAIFPVAIRADSVHCYLDDIRDIGTSSVFLSVAGANVTIPLDGPTRNVDLTNIAKGALTCAGHTVHTYRSRGDWWLLDDISTAGITVQIAPGGAQEARNRILIDPTPYSRIFFGQIRFGGSFDPYEQGHHPATFTAGIITDVGELDVRINAAQLEFMTDGPIICQALFQRLAPRAPQYGAQINYAGDRLEVYFDPAYTVTQGGVIFGTTSPSQGCLGTMQVQ